MFGLFGNKKRVDELRKEVRSSFDNVKQDFNKVGEWIRHIDKKQEEVKLEFESMKKDFLEIHSEISEIKESISFFKMPYQQPLSKQTPTMLDKQTRANVVQTPVQTPVQTDILDSLTVMERGIIWALINSDMKLSYEDIASLLGKDKSTIRGQINSIKQKNKDLITEYKEPTGKKRIYISEEMREKVLKSVKVRVKNEKNSKK